MTCYYIKSNWYTEFMIMCTEAKSGLTKIILRIFQLQNNEITSYNKL